MDSTGSPYSGSGDLKEVGCNRSYSAWQTARILRSAALVNYIVNLYISDMTVIMPALEKVHDDDHDDAGILHTP